MFESEAKFRALLEAAPDAIVWVAADGRIALVNAQAEALFAYKREELIGQLVEILVPQAAREMHSVHRSGYAATPVTRPMGAGMELAARRKDGSEFPAEISLSTIETEEGTLVSAAIRDGTVRKQAAIISSSPHAIISKNLEGIILSWNPAAERLYGYRASEIIGRSVEVLLPPDRLEEELTVLRRIGDGERIPEYETVRVRADGTQVDVASTMWLITDHSGAAVGVSTIARDISERKQAEADRRALEDRMNQSQRLESLGQLAGGIAHDFNNLLAVILNYAGFVADEIKDNESARADVEEIRAAAERAARLTHQLLIFGRRETIEPELLDLSTIVDNVQTLLSRTIGEHVGFVVRTPANLPAIRADRGQMEQVLLNLAVNARDAMPEGGTLTIETDIAELDEAAVRVHPGMRPGRHVQLSVSDTGVGMSPDVIARAFEPFFSTKSKEEGTGLGLATVYGIVTEAGGSVTIDSEPGLGTTVRVYIPADEEAIVSAPGNGHQKRSAEHSESVLVVEDQDAMRRVTARILRRNGFSVIEAASGEEALSLATENAFQLLLTDVVMPQMSGRELAERVQELKPGVAVLFMSGYSQGVLGPRRALEDGVVLIQKPFTERALLEKVHSAMSLHPSD
jgi:PAS domain S-box-containing protein